MKNKFYGVLGLGISGISTVKYFKENNFDFILWDDNKESTFKLCNSLGITKNICTPENNQWEKLDFLIKSPGISLNTSNKIINNAKQNNIPIISDIELFYLLNPKANYVGITGTNGKSTTTSLIAHILQSSGLKTYVGGNIGFAVMSLEHHNTPEYHYVLEVSSFQLASTFQTKFNIGIILNITPDHLDWHGTIENYIKDKFKIIQNQDEDCFFIFNGKDQNIISYVNKLQIKSKKIPFYSNLTDKTSYQINGLTIYNPKTLKSIKFPNNKYLNGTHNSENLIAAYLAANALGIADDKIIKAVETFIGLKHRLQPVAETDKILFINDSKATNFDSTEKALEATNYPILLIMGGKEKDNSDFELINKYKSKILTIFLIGEAQEHFFDKFKKLNFNCQKSFNLEQAFNDATHYSKTLNKKVALLLSPGCASYDQYKNFEERGENFIILTQNYINNVKSL